MSTANFSQDNTASVIVTVVRNLFPKLTPHQVMIVHKIVRKAAHAFEYFVLGLLLLRALQIRTRRRWSFGLSFLALIGVVLWAIGDEFHQLFVSTRQASVRDVGIDTAGGFLAQIISAFWYRYISK